MTACFFDSCFNRVHAWLDCSLRAVVAGGADPGRRGRIIGKYPACAAGVNAPGYNRTQRAIKPRMDTVEARIEEACSHP